MVMVLRVMHPDFEHIHDQILTGQNVPTMEDLITRLLRIPTTKIFNSSSISVEANAMVTASGFRDSRGTHGARGGHGSQAGQCAGCPQRSYCKRLVHTKDTCYSLHEFPKETINVVQTVFGHIEEKTIDAPFSN
ncbi:hypothetical protein HN51_026391 [Arachis hypogaea]